MFPIPPNLDSLEKFGDCLVNVTPEIPEVREYLNLDKVGLVSLHE